MEKKGKKIGISMGILLVALFGTVGVVFGGIRGKDADDITGDHPGWFLEEGETWDGNMPEVGETSEQTAEFTEIPGYAKVTITEEKQELELINPEGNTVYFVYTIKENGETLYQTGAIEPNKFVRVNLFEMLEKGTHTLEMSIACYDVETKAVCNGAAQEVEVTVR